MLSRLKQGAAGPPDARDWWTRGSNLNAKFRIGRKRKNRSRVNENSSFDLLRREIGRCSTAPVKLYDGAANGKHLG